MMKSTFFSFAGSAPARARPPPARPNSARTEQRSTCHEKRVAMSVPSVGRLVEVAARSEMLRTPRDPSLPLLEAGFRLAADPLDLHGVGAAEADAVEDLPDA